MRLPEAPAAGGRSPGNLVRAIRWLYHFHFQDERRERLFLASLAFLVTFAVVRAITHMIRAGIGPFHDVGNGALHIHHLVWGILILLLVGYAWLIQPAGDWIAHITALAFGVGAALTLDEFALWLNLSDVYWAQQGRESIDAVVTFAALLAVGFWGYPLMADFVRLVRAQRRCGCSMLNGCVAAVSTPEVSQSRRPWCLIIGGRQL